MKAIPREAGRITYSTEIRNLKNRLRITDVQRAVIIGSILGDGNLSGNWSQTNYRLRVSHSVKQSEYLSWKYEILRNFILTKPQVYEKTKSISFRTISHHEFTELYKLFYPSGKKVVPRNIEELIKDPIIIAVWFMDDGNIRKVKNKIYGYYLNTQSFNLVENQILREALKNNFGINSMVMRNHGKYRIYIGALGKEKFSQLVSDIVIKSMKYKIG